MQHFQLCTYMSQFALFRAKLGLVTSTGVFILTLYANTAPAEIQLKSAACLITTLRGQFKCVSTESTKVSPPLSCPPCWWVK